MKLKPVPVIGKKYTFFEASNNLDLIYPYVCTVTDIISMQRAAQIIIQNRTLINIWESERNLFPNTYAKETDLFIETDIPEYDPYNKIYFARHVDGGWFSFDGNSISQAGRLDLDSSMCAAYYEYKANEKYRANN